jgi:integrase
MPGTIAPHRGTDGRITAWYVRRRVRDADTGRMQRLQRSYATRAEAVAGDAAWSTELARGTATGHSRVTVGELLAEWLSDMEGHLAPSTLRMHEQAIRVHLVPGLGAHRVTGLTVAHVERFYAAMAKGGSSRATIVIVAKPLRQAVARAERRGLVPRNVARLAQKPAGRPEDGERIKAWTRAEVGRFLQAAQGTPDVLVYRVLLGTGLRVCEVFGLRWTDWQPTPTAEAPHGRLRIAQIVQRGGAGTRLSPRGKSPAAHRLLYVTASVASTLEAQRAAVDGMRSEAGEAWQEHGLVFPLPTGAWRNPNYLHRRFHRIARAAGVPELTPHGTRHTYSTLAIEAGVPIPVISRNLGHANVAITLSIYGHAISSMQTTASAVMEGVIFGPVEGD